MNQGIRRTLSLSALLLMLAVTLAACGSADDEVDPTVTRVDVAYTPSTPVAEDTPESGTPDGTPDDGGEGDGGGQATSVDLNMVDIAFEPTELTIPANTDVTINLTNSGALPHAFEIPDQGIASSELPGGGAETLTINLPPGEYAFICPVPGHADAGMVGTLIVEEGGAAAPPAGGDAASDDEGASEEVAGAPTEVELVMVDIAFEPADFTIAANTDVTINLPNQGALPHAFEIPDQGIASDEVAGGGSTSVVVNLPPGEYPFICPVPGHADAGMVGTLIVVEGGGAASAGEEPAGESAASEASPPASPEASPAASPVAELPTEVELVMIDIAFEPTELTIPANTDVTINLPNQGALPHAFEIPDQGIATEEVPGGGSTSVVVNLPPGEYRFICPVPGHESAGMLGTLTVVDESAAQTAEEPGGEAAAGSDAPTTVDLNMVDIAFEPADFTIAANTDVTINLTNSGALPHAFQLEDGSVASEELAGGGSTTVTLNLPPGTYPYICPVPGHADAGMVGTITVE